MIYITGDCHGDFRKFSSDNFPEQEEMTKDDFVIICGDFGLWHDTPEERYWLHWLSEKSFTILFVDGNHENFDRLNSEEFPVVDFHGGKAHQIRDNIFHLMRGYVFELCGKKFFCFGGAKSHDIKDGILDEKNFTTHKQFARTKTLWRKKGKIFRVNHESWWKEEMPTEEEMEFGIRVLKENNNQVDYIISHCCPHEIETIYSLGKFESDILTNYFDRVAQTVHFTNWFFGHYHNDKRIMSKYIMLYTQIIRIV